MLIIKLLGVAVVVGLVVKWKRMRLPLLLLLLMLLLLSLLRSSCSHDEPVKLQDHGPIKPHDDVCPYPDIGCKEPGAVPDGGQGVPYDLVPTTSDEPACPDRAIGCA